MFTANIAGSAGSHLRPELPHRDSYPHNSNPNLLDIEGESYAAASAEEKRYLSARSQKDGEQTDQVQVQQWLREYRIKKCLSDYKTWGYMVCIASVVIGGIILVILTATGIISTNSSGS